MKIVVLDGYALNPGDLSWEPLKQLAPCEIYDRSAPSEIVQRAAEAEILVINKVTIGQAEMAALPDLQYIGMQSTGYDAVDIETARKRGIIVSNVPVYGTASVAQMVFAHLLHFTQHVAEHNQSVHRSCWTACKDFCYWNTPLIELAGLTMGVVGFGRIGQATARLAQAFGMTVHACDVQPVEYEGVESTSLDDLLARSDVISLHCPLTPQTRELINADTLATVKPTALLINTSRGGLVNERDLADALNEGRLAGAGVDVLSSEPPSADNPLLHARNCVITPHISWATQAARERLMDTVIDNVRAFLAGTPQNVVS